MSPVSQSCIFEVEFEYLDQYFLLTLSTWKLLERLQKSLNFTDTCLYEPWHSTVDSIPYGNTSLKLHSL